MKNEPFKFGGKNFGVAGRDSDACSRAYVLYLSRAKQGRLERLGWCIAHALKATWPPFPFPARKRPSSHHQAALPLVSSRTENGFLLAPLLLFSQSTHYMLPSFAS